jgi:hypothetical protein
MLSASVPQLQTVDLSSPIVLDYEAGHSGPGASANGLISPATTGLTSPYGGLTPAQVRGAYGVTNIGFDGVVGNGAGETIAILDPGDDTGLVNSTASNFSSSDLAIFDSYYGLINPPSFVKMGFTDTSTPTLTTTLPSAGTADDEISLDVEWSHVIAPSANILLVEGAADFSDIFNGILAVNSAASSMHIVALSMSFSSAENGALGSTANAEGVDGYYFDTPGLVYLASTGDYGAYAKGTSTIASQFPASSSNVVAVGGTTLAVSGTSWAGETTWGNGTSSGSNSGGGGGFSVFEPQPTYEVGKVNSLSSTVRTYPDISLEGDPAPGVPIYDSPDFGSGTGWFPGNVGGTSLSSPLMAGIVAIADQGRAVNGLSLLASSGGAGVTASNPNGNSSSLDIHTLLYGFGYSHSDFHDIVSGSSVGPSSYGPLTNYDLSSGIGSPNGSRLIADLADNTVTSLTLTGPTFYLQLDSDLVHLDIYAATSAGGILYDSTLASQLTSLKMIGTGSPETLTIDFTNGNPIPAGITDTDSGSSSSNQVIAIGTASGNDTIVSSTGLLTINGSSITYSDVGTTSFTPGTGTDALTVNSGTLQLARRTGSGILADLFSTLIISGSSKLAVAVPATHATRVLVDTAALTIAGGINSWTGTLDLSGNDLAVTGGSLTTIQNQVASGYAGSKWNGTGIDSSLVAADSTHLTALGTILNNSPLASPLYGSGTSLGTFDLSSPGSAAILVKYTYYSDANLDGKVDASDYSRIDNGFLTHQTGWYNGDFNYDGVVNGSDYTLTDNTFNTQGASLASQIATSTPAIAASRATPIFSTQPVTNLSDLIDDSTTQKHHRAIDDVGL